MNQQATSIDAASLVSTPPPVTASVAGPVQTSTTPPAAAAPAAPPPPAPANAGGPAPGTPDAKGVPFDPEKHLPKPHGRTLCWMPRRRSAKDAPATGPAEPPPPASGSFIPPADPLTAETGPIPTEGTALEYRAAASAATGLFFTAGILAFGEGGVPSRAEAAAVQEGWETWLKSVGYRDVPPWLPLVVASIAYAGPRAVKPETLTRWGKFQAWYRGLFARRVAQRMAAGVAEARAQANPEPTVQGAPA